MKRTAGAFLVAAALGGCMSAGQHRPWPATNNCSSCGSHSAAVPAVQGPWGQPITARGVSHGPMDMGSGVMQASHAGGAGGAMQVSHHPLAGHSGSVAVPPPPYGAVAAAGAVMPGMAAQGPAKRTEIRFLGPDGTKIRWMNGGPDGRPMPSPQALSVPARYNFSQGAVYRLKLDVPREDLPALYPTLEIVPSNARTDVFLTHSAVPVAFSNEDFDQVKAGNYVTKVIYLPDPQFQDLATAGPEEIVSTRLEPGADPIAEAYRRGSILAVVRFGNIDLELPHSPPLGSTRPAATGLQQVGMSAGAPPKTEATSGRDRMPGETVIRTAPAPKRWWSLSK